MNAKREKMNQLLKTGCFLGCLLLPFSASAITFDEQPEENGIAATQNTAVAQAAVSNEASEANLAALAGQPGVQSNSAVIEEAPIAGRKTSERGVLSWIALGLLGLGAFGTLVLLKKKKVAGEQSMASLEVIQSIRIGAKHQVSLVRVPGATLVLGVTEKGIQTLAELPAQAPVMEAAQVEAPVENQTAAPVEEAPNPFLDKVLNMTQKSAPNKSANPFAGIGDLSADSERRAVLRRLEQYRQTI